jgi:hypothetical protein
MRLFVRAAAALALTVELPIVRMNPGASLGRATKVSEVRLQIATRAVGRGMPEPRRSC